MKIIAVVIRIIALPFFSVLGLIYAIRMWVEFTVGFLIHGGEVIQYRKDHDETIAGVMNLLKEKLRSEQNPERSVATEADSSNGDDKQKADVNNS